MSWTDLLRDICVDAVNEIKKLEPYLRGLTDAQQDIFIAEYFRLPKRERNVANMARLRREIKGG